MPKGHMNGLNFQNLSIGWSDAEQEPYPGWAIVYRRAMPLFENHTIPIYRPHEAIGTGADSRASGFPSPFHPRRPSCSS